MQPYAVPVVVPVSEPAGGAFHLLGQPVRALGAGVDQAGREEHLDGRPRGFDRLGQCGQPGDLRIGAPPVERVEAVANLARVPATGRGRAERASSSLAIHADRIAPVGVVVDAAAVPHPGQRRLGQLLGGGERVAIGEGAGGCYGYGTLGVDPREAGRDVGQLDAIGGVADLGGRSATGSAC